MSQEESAWDMLFTNQTWFFFYTAAGVIEDRLGVPGGVAQRKLREACASGDIRSKWLVPSGSGEWRYETVKPSEWAKDQMDLEWLRRDDVVDTLKEEADPLDELEPDPDNLPGPAGIYVNGDDFRYWLDKLKPPAEPAARSPHKRDFARQAVDVLWPDGVPEELINKQIEKQVGDWLKAKGLPEISRDTILRAAGRK
jgi:hypothetical protein